MFQLIIIKCKLHLLLQMKKNSWIIFMLLLTLNQWVLAQNGTVSTGTSLAVGNRKISCSIGQPFYAFKSGSNGKVRDGIQQPLPVMLNVHLYIEGFYLGGGMLAEVLGNGICDSIRVELHDPLSPSTIIYAGICLLSVQGNARLILPPALRGDSYYVVIRHRNSIETWSKLPIYMTASSTFNLKTN